MAHRASNTRPAPQLSYVDEYFQGIDTQICALLDHLLTVNRHRDPDSIELLEELLDIETQLDKQLIVMKMMQTAVQGLGRRTSLSRANLHPYKNEAQAHIASIVRKFHFLGLASGEFHKEVEQRRLRDYLPPRCTPEQRHIGSNAVYYTFEFEHTLVVQREFPVGTVDFTANRTAQSRLAAAFERNPPLDLNQAQDIFDAVLSSVEPPRPVVEEPAPRANERRRRTRR